MNTEPLQISDAAREAARHELGYHDEQPIPAIGHFVQLLLNSEREKWEKEQQAILNSIGCTSVQQLKENHLRLMQDFNKEHLPETATSWEEVFQKHAETIQERDQLRQQLLEAHQQLLEAQVALMVKDEALKLAIEELSAFGPSDEDVVYQKALSPDCHQPLLEAVKEMKEALEKLSVCNCSFYERDGDHSKHCHKFIAQQALAKAKELNL